MTKVIVSGANGFIGQALCKHLSKRGIKVIALVRGKSSNIDNIKYLNNVLIVSCSMDEYDTLLDKEEFYYADAFYHLAWQGCAGEDRKNENIQLNNVRNTCSAMKVAKKLSVGKFIYASSIMEYEIELQLKKGGVAGIQSIYSIAKHTADYMLRVLAQELNIDYIRAIISNIYGPNEKNKRLINSSIRKLLKGEHCSFSAGEQEYDFIYIDDAVEAFALLGSKGEAGKFYYIGSEEHKKLKDYLRILGEETKKEDKIGLGEIPFCGESLDYKMFEPFSMKVQLGFFPKTDFRQGINNMIRYIEREETIDEKI